MKERILIDDTRGCDDSFDKDNLRKDLTICMWDVLVLLSKNSKTMAIESRILNFVLHRRQIWFNIKNRGL